MSTTTTTVEVMRFELKEFGSWSEQTSSAGRKYYYNSSTEISQWEKPREWKEAELKLEKERIEQKIQASRAHASSSSSGPNGAPPSSEASSAPPPPPPPPMGFMNMPPPPFLPPPFGAPPPPFGAPPPPFGGQFSSMPPPIPPPMGAFFPPPMFQPPPPPPAALLPKAVPPPAAMTSFQSTAVPPPPVGPRTLATTITTSAATTTSAAMMMMPSHVNNCNGPPPPPPPGHHQQPGPMSSAPPSTMSQPFQSQLGHGPSREQRERDAQGPSPVHLTRNSRDHEMGGNASRRTPQPISNSERRSSTASYIKREMSSGTPTPRGDHNDMANPNVANGDRDYFDEPRDRKRSHVTATPTPTLTPTTAMTTHPLARNSGDSVAKKMCGRQDDAGTNGTPFGNSAGKVTSLGSALTDANTTHLTSKGQLPVAVHDIKTECRSENAPMDQDDKWRPKSRCKSDSPLERKPFLPLMKRNPEVWADMMRFYDQRLAEEKARELGLNDELDRRELMKCRMQELKMEAELAQELDSMCSASNVAAVQSFESRLLLVKLNGLRKTMEAMCENLSERMDIGQAMTSTSTTTTTTTMTTTSTTTLPAGTTAT